MNTTKIHRVEILQNANTYIVKVCPGPVVDEHALIVERDGVRYGISHRVVEDYVEALGETSVGVQWEQRSCLSRRDQALVLLHRGAQELFLEPPRSEEPIYTITRPVDNPVPESFVGSIVDILPDKDVVVVSWSSTQYSAYPLKGITGLAVGDTVREVNGTHLKKVNIPPDTQGIVDVLICQGDRVWVNETLDGLRTIRVPEDAIREFPQTHHPAGCVILNVGLQHKVSELMRQRSVFGEDSGVAKSFVVDALLQKLNTWPSQVNMTKLLAVTLQSIAPKPV